MINFGDSRTSINETSRLEELANTGSNDAAYDLAVRYFEGVGVPRDYEYAIALLEKLAIGGDAIAQNVLGSVYFEGDELGLDSKGMALRQNRDRGVYWLTMSADGGNRLAQSKLILMAKRNEFADEIRLKKYQESIVRHVLGHPYRAGIAIGVGILMILVFGVVYLAYLVIVAG